MEIINNKNDDINQFLTHEQSIFNNYLSLVKNNSQLSEQECNAMQCKYIIQIF